MNPTDSDIDWKTWLADTMSRRPKGNSYIECPRGIEVGDLLLALEREMFSWRRSDPDTFWIDVQLFVKYKLSDDDIRFIASFEPGIDQYRLHAEERHAYAEMTRGLKKLKSLMMRRLSEQARIAEYNRAHSPETQEKPE